MRSLNSKLAGLVAVAVLGAVALGSCVAAWRDAQSRLDSKREELSAYAGLLATMAGEPMSRGDKAAATRVLTSIGRRPDIRYARLTDTTSRLVAEFGTGVIVSRQSGPIDAAPELNPFTTIYLGTYPVAADVIAGGTTAGRLVMIADLSSLRAALLDSLASSLLAGALVAMIGIAAATRLQRRLTRPIGRLTRAMQDVRDRRDYAHAVPHASGDEIGQMVDAFNAMLAEIRVRDGDLTAHRDRLEIEVAERTAEYLAAKDSAEAANAAKSDFLATMSHEIRTPMNGMLVMAELMSVSGLSPRLQRYSDVLVKSGHSLLAIINDILDFSKIESGKMTLEAVPVDPRAIVDDVLKLFSERASSKGLDLGGYVSPEVPRRLAADPVRLNQILSNLVNNALKFTESGGISIDLSVQGETSDGALRLVLDVTDTGIGIADDKLTAIFEAFSQADQSTTRRFGGTGIGLTICRRLTEAMAGAIKVRSKEGFGSTFSVEFCATAIEPPSPLAVSPRRGIIALIALPDGPSRRALKRMARDCGFEVLAADPASITSADAAYAGVIIAETRTLKRLRPDALDAASAPITIALTRFGASRQANNTAQGAADATLEMPVSTAEAMLLLGACAGGRTELRVLTQNANLVANSTTSLKRFPGVRILAADDGAVNRELLIEALSRLDVSVTCVENGREALEAMKSGGFDLVFMDGSMPVMDGFEACRAMRAFEVETGRTALPVIALTAHVLGELADAWRDAGMNACLTKPFTLASLQACLDRWLADPGVAAAAPADEAVPDTDSSNPPAGTGDVVFVDRGTLDAMRDMQQSGEDLVARMIAIYGDHAPKAYERLRDAMHGQGHLSTADAAHALKSLSLSIGAIKVSVMCGEIEVLARAEGIGRIDALVEQLGPCLAATIAALEALASAAADTRETGRLVTMA